MRRNNARDNERQLQLPVVRVANTNAVRSGLRSTEFLRDRRAGAHCRFWNKRQESSLGVHTDFSKSPTAHERCDQLADLGPRSSRGIENRRPTVGSRVVLGCCASDCSFLCVRAAECRDLCIQRKETTQDPVPTDDDLTCPDLPGKNKNRGEKDIRKGGLLTTGCVHLLTYAKRVLVLLEINLSTMALSVRHQEPRSLIY